MRIPLEVYAVLTRRFLAAAAVALLAILPLAAQDKVNLTWKFEANKPFYQEMTTTANQSMKVMGQDVTQKQTQTFWFSYTPTAPDSNGNVTITQKIEGVRIQIDINNNPVSYDSTSATAANSPLSEFFKQLVGAEFKLTLDKAMKVTKVEGREDFIRKLGGANAAMEPLLKQILNEDALKQMADPTFGVLPGKEVAKGEKWERKSELKLGPIGGYNNTYTYTYDGKDAKDANLHNLKVETKLEYKTPEASEGLPFKIKSANLTSKNAGGIIKFDAAKGRIAEQDLKLQLEGSLEIEIGGTSTKVELKQEQTTIVKTGDASLMPAKK